MNRVTITLTIDLPDGVIPDVGYSSHAEAPRPTVAATYGTVATGGAVLPAEPRHVAEMFPPFAGAAIPAEFWPVGECPVHHKPFQDGRYGPFCSAQGGNGPLNKKGYCDLKPGAIYGGKGIPLLPVATPA